MSEEKPYQMLGELFTPAEITILKEDIKQLVLTAIIEALKRLNATRGKT